MNGWPRLRKGEVGLQMCSGIAHVLPLKVCIIDLSPNRLVAAVGGVGGAGAVRLAAAAWSATAIPILVSFFALLTRELELGGAPTRCTVGVESVSVSAPSAELIRLRESSS